MNAAATRHDRRLARMAARMHAQDEALRREAWRLNAPVRVAAADLATLLGAGQPAPGDPED